MGRYNTPEVDLHALNSSFSKAAKACFGMNFHLICWLEQNCDISCCVFCLSRKSASWVFLKLSGSTDKIRSIVIPNEWGLVIVVYFLPCSYLEQLTDYLASCATVGSVVQFSVLYFLSECNPQAGWISEQHDPNLFSSLVSTIHDIVCLCKLFSHALKYGNGSTEEQTYQGWRAEMLVMWLQLSGNRGGGSK